MFSLTTTMHKDRRRLLLLLVIVGFLLLLFMLSQKYVKPLHPFTNAGLKKWRVVHEACLTGTSADIELLVETVASLATCRNIQARRAIELLDRIYLINRRKGKVVLPDTFQDKVRGWLGNDKELFDEVGEQTITSILNRITYEEAIFNPLRGKRPGANSGMDDINTYLSKIVKDTAASCDFCRFASSTARDDFGRIESVYAVTASNTFKYDALHALIILRKHDPRDWTLPEFLDLMSVAMRWFDKAHSLNPRAQYPHLMWDLLPKASASQLHPHAQASLSPQRYYGTIENLRHAMQTYDHDYPHDNYFTHLVQVHDMLGLAFHYGNATALAYITPRKESEVFVIASTPCEDFFTLLHHVIRTFVEDFGFHAWSMGMSLPPLGFESNMPAIARIIDCGLPTSARSDISALELFAASNVNADPFVLMRKLRPLLHKRLKAGDP